ncbi:polyphenol oxidase family protein [Rubrobacter tropicus]|uniref:polyphenol oxidase family protein n=1 Tax=Rubrobacter tropicus TaxID=2653851 RepID=UPI00140C1907|nr:polyphenol oxidase family protein [Rubrobacter tropicus]
MRARISNLLHDGAPAATHTAAGGAVYVSPQPGPEGAKVFFFTRLGGVSRPPFDSLNVSVKVGDDPDAVAGNISTIREALGGGPSAWVKQVAGDGVLRVTEGGFAGEADALVTSTEGLSLNVAVADCVPVALVGQDEVAMIHSGWRGTLAGISGKAAGRMAVGAKRAYIGPCIRGCCYEVSEELAGAFAAEFGDGVVSGRNLSLPGAIRTDLERSGVEVTDLGLCTGCRPDLFFSHRKQKPATGRSLAAVVKVGR